MNKEKLIVALDLQDVKQAEQMVAKLGDHVEFYKIGYQLAFTGGLELARDLKRSGKKIFLDLKLLDIDNTIFKAVENIKSYNFDMLSLHAYPHAMKAAVDAARGSDLCLLAVTVLTSMDANDLAMSGYSYKPHDLALKRAEQAKELGMGGVVSSGQDSANIRKMIGSEMAVVVPGIRIDEDAQNDQKRAVTPEFAIKNGASHLVVGRSIIAAQDPLEKAIDISEKIRETLK